jgi:hypothetical protein
MDVSDFFAAMLAQLPASGLSSRRGGAVKLDALEIADSK